MNNIAGTTKTTKRRSKIETSRSSAGPAGTAGLALLVVLVLLAASCGFGAEEAVQAANAGAPETTLKSSLPLEPAPAPVATPEPVAEIDPIAANRPAIAPFSLSSGPITVTATICEVPDYEMAYDSEADGFATAGDRLFVGSEAGVIGFSVALSSGCVLSPDTSLGEGGFLTTEPDYDSLSGNASGRLVAGGIFGALVFDTNNGTFFECEASGRPALSADGATLLAHWPGSEEVDSYTLSDGSCSAGDPVRFGTQFVSTIAMAQNEVLVGASDGDGLDYLASFAGPTGSESTAAQWQVGSREPGDPAWIASVLGISPCGQYTCLTEWFGSLLVVDSAGTLLAAFDIEDELGVDSLGPLGVGLDGSVYLMANSSVETDDGNYTYYHWIVRLEVN